MRNDIKKRRAKYENVETPAMRLFHDKEMITERKSGMNFVHFKYMQSIQKRAIKLLFPKEPDRRVAALMKPTTPSLHLQYEVAKRQAIKNGQLEQVKPVDFWFPNFLTSIFNFFRKLSAQNDGTTRRELSALI
jgi:hypothetical protein